MGEARRRTVAARFSQSLYLSAIVDAYQAARLAMGVRAPLLFAWRDAARHIGAEALLISHDLAYR